MELFRLSIMLVLTLFIGWNAVYFAFLRRSSLHVIESLALSFGIGAGLITLQMFIYSMAGIQFDLGRIIAPWVALFFINVLIHKAEGLPDMAVGAKDESLKRPITIFLLSAIAAQSAVTFFRALIKPIESYDGVAIYAIKAKIFYIANIVPGDFFARFATVFPHPDYPINIPLFETLAYISMGIMNDQLVKLIFPLFYLAVIVMLYYAVRRFSTRAYALLFAFALASIPQFAAYATNAYHDMVLSFYTFGGVLFLLLWFNDRESAGFLMLSAVMTALAGWTKNEGLLYCITNIILLSAYVFANMENLKKRDWTYFVYYIAIILAISAPWTVFKAMNNISNEEIDLARANPIFLAGQLGKLKVILYEFQKEFFGPKKWLMVWPLAAAALICRWKKAFAGTNKYIALSLALTVSGYIVFYMISKVDTAYFVSKTWSRFLLHFLPLVIYWTAITMKDDIDL